MKICILIIIKLYSCVKQSCGPLLQKLCSKVQHILQVWSAGQGVVSLHCFQNVIPVEAFTREACMVDAIGQCPRLDRPPCFLKRWDVSLYSIRSSRSRLFTKREGRCMSSKRAVGVRHFVSVVVLGD